MKKWIKSLVALSSLGFLTASGEPLPNLNKAVEAQRKIVADRPGDARAYNDLGNLLALANDRDGAEQAYRHSLDLAPNNASTRFNLGLLLQQSAREDEAKSEFEQLLEISPDHGWAHYQLGVIAEASGKRSDALERYARAFALDPTLSFASTNPQVIDNRMATEALLLSARYADSAPSAETRVPRLYDDPDRIADLMLQTSRDEESDGSAGDSTSAAQGGDSEGSGAAAGGSGSATGTPGRLRDGGSGGVPVGDTRGASRGGTGSGRSGRQVVPPAAGPWCGSRERLRPAPAGRRRSAPQLPAVAPRRLPPPADGSRETWSGLRREAIAPTGLGPPVVPSIGRPSAARAGSSSDSRLPSSRLWRSRRARPRPRLPAPEPAGSCRWRGSDVEAKVSDVAVLHHVLLALQSQKTLVASRGQGLFA